MITTRFLTPNEYKKYSLWLKKLSDETRNTYFGVYQSDEQIDRLVEGIICNSDRHNFLVAEFNGEWIGAIHIAETDNSEVEFGVIVDEKHRGRGIADRMIGEAITWARNRGYRSLYMHCLRWNMPIKRLCLKHGMHLASEGTETDTKMNLPPADITSVSKELMERNRNIYRMLLQSTIPFLNKVYA